MPAVPVDLLVAQGEVTDARTRPGAEWVSAVETVAVTDGTRNVLRMWHLDDGRRVDLLSDPEPAAGRGLSGGAHAWHPSGRWVVAVVRGGGVVAVSVDGASVTGVDPLPFDAARSWWGPEFTADGRELHIVADWQEVVGLDTETLETWTFHDANDFAMNPAGLPGGVAHVWDRPHMAWTTSSIRPGAVHADVAAQQPRRSADGRVHGWIDDASGWWNVVVDDGGGDTVRMADAHEHGGPTWGPGQRSWCLSPDGSRVAIARNDDGYCTLVVREVRGDGAWEIGRGVHGCLSWDGDVVSAVRSGARTPQQLVAYRVEDVANTERRVLCDPADPRWGTDHDVDLVEPSVHRTTSGVPYRLYAPRDAHGGLLVWVHGGPEDQWQVTFRPRIVSWVSRGWTIAVPDHRGTTGHGRAFREALHGGWGDVDVADTADVVHALHATGHAPATTVMMGASAGGLTALGVAARHPELVAGVVVAYPVVDLAEMLRHDDPWEGHHMPCLLGTADPDAPHLVERSPLSRAAALARVPMLLFHGDMDQSVPLVHSERLVAAVRDAGGEVELVVLAGEGHGFKRPENVRREHETTEAFLAAVLARAPR